MEFTDRYQGWMPYPDPATMCLGQCEGTGMYPQHIADPAMTDAERIAWRKCHRETCSLLGRLHSPWKAIRHRDRIWLGLAWEPCDGWHFIKCAQCGGSGKRVQA